MENENVQSQPMMTYVVSAVLIVLVLAGAWYFRSQSAPTPSTAVPTTQLPPIVTPTLGPITKLGCDKQYYNQKIAFNEYYLSLEGSDVSEATNVTCEFTAKVKDKVLVKATAEGPLSADPQRGGSTFRCISNAVAIEPNVVTTIDVTLTDDLKVSSTCSADFVFPSR